MPAEVQTKETNKQPENATKTEDKKKEAPTPAPMTLEEKEQAKFQEAQENARLMPQSVKDLMNKMVEAIEFDVDQPRKIKNDTSSGTGIRIGLGPGSIPHQVPGKRDPDYIANTYLPWKATISLDSFSAFDKPLRLSPRELIDLRDELNKYIEDFLPAVVFADGHNEAIEQRNEQETAEDRRKRLLSGN